jgi:hypothetical protein
VKEAFVLIKKKYFVILSVPLHLQWQVFHDQLLLKLPRVGIQQGQVVERCDESSLPFFFIFNIKKNINSFELHTELAAILTSAQKHHKQKF